MKIYKVLATFASAKPAVGIYVKSFGPFTIRSQAEATLVQLSGQASCQGAEVIEAEES